jgi:CHAT domain-containing protein/Tfp pilus assembly protein PilF
LFGPRAADWRMTETGERILFMKASAAILGQVIVAAHLALAPGLAWAADEDRDLEALATALRQAETHRRSGEYAEAIPYLNKALAVTEKIHGATDPRTAAVCANLAACHLEIGGYARAEPLLQRALRIDQANANQENIAWDLNSLGELYRRMRQYARAKPLFRRSLKINERERGKDHLQVGIVLNNLALCYRDEGEFARAEPLYRRSLNIFQEQLPADHPQVALGLNNLAMLYRVMGQPGRAEPLCRRALAILQKQLGADHLQVAVGQGNLAYLYYETGQYRRALPLARRSLKVYQDRLGENGTFVAQSQLNLALLEAARGRWREAALGLDRARRLFHRHIGSVLPVLAEDEQLKFLNGWREVSLKIALALALKAPRPTRLEDVSAEWLLNGKGLAQRVLAERVLLARDGTEPRLTGLLQKLTECRSRLARLTHVLPRPGREQARLDQLARLTREEQELSRELGQAAGRDQRAADWANLKELRQALPADAVLIDIARFDVWEFQPDGEKPRWHRPRYAAWVIPPADGSAVRLVDLGRADRIEAAVAEVRRTLQRAPAALDQAGERQAEQQLQRSLQGLAALVLGPLRAPIEGKKRWLISPDAALWLVPWAMLPLPGGSYAAEKHNISYVTSGRDLLAAAPAARTTAPLVLADPAFDVSLKKAAAQTRRLLPSLQARRGGSLRVSSALGKRHWERLPGTAVEARAIAPLLERWAGSKPRLLTGERALEGVFKAVRSPKAVVLSTHGFFLDDQEGAVPVGRGLKLAEAGPAPRPVRGPHRALENPLLRCGLVFAGANHRGGEIQAGQEDGILTGLEIVGCDLRGTELVVLSACETGLGKVNVGEGVAGLRQAFQLAGARAVVATLWQIPDQETTALMKAFFTHLAAKKGKAEALRQAQLDIIQRRRARGKAAHPFYWAAFTLTGQWQ